MKSPARLAFYLTQKYLQRGRVWTLLLTSFMMMVAFVNLIFVPALFNGIITGTNNQIINTFTGNIFLSPKDGEDYLADSDKIVDELKTIPEISAVSPRTQLQSRLEYKSYRGNWQTLAIDPDLEEQVTNVADKMMSGEYLSENDEDQIIIGRQIAGGEGVEENAFSFKGAQVGEKVSLVTDAGIKEFTIKGIFYTKFLESDKKAFITQKALEKIIPKSQNKSTTINIKTVEKSDDNLVMDEIREKDIAANVYKWDEAAGLMKAVASSFISVNVIMSMAAILIAAVTVFIVIYVDIVNKRKQIGILRAIGIKPYIIVSSYVILSAVYAIIGVLLGTAVFFFILTPYFSAYPFSLPMCDAVLDLKYTDYIARSELIMWVSVFSGLIPSLVVVRTKMLDAILGR